MACSLDQEKIFVKNLSDKAGYFVIAWPLLKLKVNRNDIDFLGQIFPKGVVFFDLETTGLSPQHSEILEIGAIKIKNGQASFFSELAKPTGTIPPFITELTGITNKMVSRARPIDSVFSDFIAFLENGALMAHNATFDIGHLMATCFRLNMSISDRNVYCSCKLSRKSLDAPNYKLATIVSYLKLVPPGNLHRAATDAYMVYKIAVTILSREGNLNKLPISMIGNQLMAPKKNLQLLPADIIDSQQPIEILYLGGSHPGVFRPIRPIAILQLMNGTVVLYALCLLSNVYKNFDVKKIVEFRT
jgi:DNA polymerase III epsilon subunit family exonuclease